MTNLEQVLVIVEKEIKSKKMLMEHDGNDKASRNYWQGGMNALIYIRHVIQLLIKESNEPDTD